MKRRTALSLGATAEDSSQHLSFWWKDPERLVHRVLLLAKDNAAIRAALIVGLNGTSKRGRPSKVAWNRTVVDIVEYVDHRVPKVKRRQGESKFDLALQLLQKEWSGLPPSVTADSIRGIYNRNRRPKR